MSIPHKAVKFSQIPNKKLSVVKNDRKTHSLCATGRRCVGSYGVFVLRFFAGSGHPANLHLREPGANPPELAIELFHFQISMGLGAILKISRRVRFPAAAVERTWNKSASQDQILALALR